jgi:outer membrane protein OmpA-like peptidoglycan-associated protein
VIRLGLGVPFSVPTAGDSGRENLIGEDGFTFSPMLLLSFNTDVVDVGVNGGVRLRKDQGVAFSESQESIVVGHQLFASFGPKFHIVQDRVDLVGDIWASAALEEQDTEEFPLEALGGLRFYIANGLVANAGGGAGLTRGIGAPTLRIVAGVGYEFKEDPDPDRDGILYDDDKCPLRPEDRDGFEDANGCPDPDNDQDQVLDAKDKCPLVAEDRDGFRDGDGCPDPDNDSDQIADQADKCPDDPEDRDRFQDDDGCPEPDNDQDGVLDPDDQCPLEPEDVDSFEDANGCPDPDNDQDGVLDPDDKCPQDPEDADKFEDTDGCPDPDNDNDGIADEQDKCPLEPEVFNSFEDEDGCPDKKRGPVQVEHGKITAPPVFFATNDDVILEASFPTLQLVAQTFKENPWIKKVRIEGHTDDRGTDEHNRDLSQRRASSVMRFLIQAGVEAERLEAQGFGESRPIASNKTRVGRAKNRRVEFVIVDPPMKQQQDEASPAGP